MKSPYLVLVLFPPLLGLMAVLSYGAGKREAEEVIGAWTDEVAFTKAKLAACEDVILQDASPTTFEDCKWFCEPWGPNYSFSCVDSGYDWEENIDSDQCLRTCGCYRELSQ